MGALSLAGARLYGEGMETFEIFLACVPGLEPVLAEEAAALGLSGPVVTPGGVNVQGGWDAVRRANLCLRGASRVLVRFDRFPAAHLSQLDKRARKVDWASVLRADVPVRVEVSCKRSKIYHQGAAKQRIETAIAEELGADISAEAEIRVMARIEDNVVTLSLDTSGAPLHRRGHKLAIGKAPLRETLAALFLRQMGYDGSEPVVDPMCGSGTIPIEAAEWAAGLVPGRSRSFAFEQMAGAEPAALEALRGAVPRELPFAFYGYDRDQGAVRSAVQNAERAGVDHLVQFACQPVSELVPPEGPAGIVLVNPPYGARIGKSKLLYALYGSLGQVLKARFRGWRVGVVTSDQGLARATGLPFKAPGPVVPHGPLKIRLYRTGVL